MKILGVEKKINGPSVRLAGRAERAGGESLEVTFEYPAEFAGLVAEGADPFVAALLLPAMAAGEGLELDLPVSERLWRSLPRICEIFHSWFPDTFKPVPLRAGAIRPGASRPEGPTASFFSLGVDSFHTLLRHEGCAAGSPPVDFIVHMTGYEAPLGEHADGRERSVVEEVRAVAARWGKKAICGRTNLRDLFPLEWGRLYHGAGLAATAHSLAAGVRRFLIPSSHPWRHIHPWGSSPITDPLWSSEELEIIHDGAATDRARKIADTIARHPDAIRSLRVCLATKGGAGNCGMCPKCIRTMVTLEMVGALRDCGAFPPRLPRGFWRLLRLKAANDHIFADENLRLARELGAPAWIRTGLERAIDLGKLDAVRRDLGTGVFLARLVRLAFFGTIGRLILLPHRRRRRAYRPEVRSGREGSTGKRGDGLDGGR